MLTIFLKKFENRARKFRSFRKKMETYGKKLKALKINFEKKRKSFEYYFCKILKKNLIKLNFIYEIWKRLDF